MVDREGTTVWSLSYLLLPVVLGLQGSGEDAIREAISRGFARYSPEQQNRATERIIAHYHQLGTEESRHRALKAIRTESQYAGRMYPGEDVYRNLHQEHPELEPLDIPDRFYHADYEIAEQIIASRLKLAVSGETRDSREVDGLKAQVRALADEARTAMKAKYQSPGMMTLIDECVDGFQKSVITCAESPFLGYHRSLSSEEMAKIKSAFRDGVASGPHVALDTYVRADPARDLAQKSESKGDRQKVREARLAIEQALHPFREIDRLQRPDVAELEEKRTALHREANKHYDELFSRLGSTYEKLLRAKYPNPRPEPPPQGLEGKSEPERKAGVETTESQNGKTEKKPIPKDSIQSKPFGPRGIVGLGIAAVALVFLLVRSLRRAPT